MLKQVIQLASGVAAALNVAVGSIGSFLVNGGALGTPASGTATNLSGTAASLTAGNATNAVNSAITDDTTTNATMYLTWVTAAAGNLPQKVSSAKFTVNPSTGALYAPIHVISGSTGNANRIYQTSDHIVFEIVPGAEFRFNQTGGGQYFKHDGTDLYTPGIREVGQRLAMRQTGWMMGNTTSVSWSSTVNWFDALDAGFARDAPGIMRSTDGGSGTGALKYTYLVSVASQTIVSGSTSGTATFSQPSQGTSCKKVIIYLAALLGTASYTFPAAFSTVNAIVTTSGLGSAIVTSLSLSAVTVTGATTTGVLIIEGY